MACNQITVVIWLDKKSHVSFISSTSQRVSAGRDGRLQKNTHCFIGCFITWYGEREMMITNRFTPKSPDNVRSGICRLRVPTRNKWNDANCWTDRLNFHCGYLSVFYTVIYKSMLLIQFCLYGIKSPQHSPQVMGVRFFSGIIVD